MKKLLLIFMAILLSLQVSKAEDKVESLRFGINLAGTINYNGLGYQDFLGKGHFFEPQTNDGGQIAPYFGIFGTYLSTDWWGVQLRLSYDSRNIFAQDNSYEPSPEFDISNNYINIEPVLIYQDFGEIENFNMFVGPQIAFRSDTKLDYDPMNSEEEKVTGADIEGMNSIVFGIMGGFDYDIPIHELNDNFGLILSPFFEFSYLFNQREPNIDGADQNSFDAVWTTTSFRVGARLSLDFQSDGIPWVYDKQFDNLQLQTPLGDVLWVREVEEHLPMVPHVFFDQGSVEIPARYAQLTKDEASDFTEDDFAKISNEKTADDEGKTKEARKQLVAYYNLLNIYGERLRENSDVTVNLIGSAPKGNDGDKMAENVKKYLVDVFGIDEDRITTEGREFPRIKSGTNATPARDRALVEVENRRVEFVFSDPLMNNAVTVKTLESTSPENDLVFTFGQYDNVNNWSVTLNGDDQDFSFGPFNDDYQRIDPSFLLENADEGDYIAKVVINKKDGSTVIEERRFRLKKQFSEKASKRYSILFDYAQSGAVLAYENFLRQNFASLVIPEERVVIQGHTDNTGNKANNLKLSKERAEEVKTIVKSEFDNTGKTVSIQTFGFGENTMHSAFKNDLPEGRFYNRSVTMEIIPIQK
jgi:outer membrane protein OmpA-like peptidoglycan-associated protein